MVRCLVVVWDGQDKRKALHRALRRADADATACYKRSDLLLFPDVEEEVSRPSTSVGKQVLYDTDVKARRVIADDAARGPGSATSSDQSVAQVGRGQNYSISSRPVTMLQSVG